MFLGSLCTGDDRVVDDGDGCYGHDDDGAGSGATDVDAVSLVVVYVSALSSLWIGSDANADERAKGSEVAIAFCNGGGCYRAGSGIKRWGGRSRRFLGVPPGQSDGKP